MEKEPIYIFESKGEFTIISNDKKAQFEKEIQTGILAKSGKYVLVFHDESDNTYFVNEKSEFVSSIQNSIVYETSDAAFESAKAIVEKYPEKDGVLKIWNLDE